MITTDRLERLKNLTPAKRALLLKHIQKEATPTEESSLIPRRARLNPSPLSFAQQRLWFLTRLEPDTPFYNVPTTLSLKGRLDIGALERTVNEIIRRHEVLRTTFAEADGQPVQIVAPAEWIVLPLIDLSELPCEIREAEAQLLVNNETRRPLDLTVGPLLRVTLLRLVEDEHVLLVTMHHIISDGWSLGLFIREMSALYQAFAAGEESSLEELEIQYADFAAWQREWLTGEVLGEQLGYWKEQLKGAPPVLELPTDRPRPPVQSYRGARQNFKLTEELSQELKELSQREGCTLFMTLLAAFQVLLSRYSGQEDVVVGSPIANRNRAEIEPLIGFFVNTLALRTDLSGEPSFREVLKRVREVTLGAYGHQDVPFEKLVEELQPERNLSHQPLFQVAFSLQNAPRETLNLPGLQLELWKSESQTTKFDLLLSVTESTEGISGAFEYSTDLFGEQSIRRFQEHFEHLLQAVVSDADQSVSAINVLTAAEHEQIVVQWNETATRYPQETCVHGLFEQQVALHPDVIAVECEAVQLTYRELNERANQLAYHLHGLGVGADSLVAILMERSVEMVVALLGVLKAGAAYVPLDASHPSARLNFILQDTAASVLLTQQHLVEQLPEHTAQVVLLDSDWEEISSHSRGNSVSEATAEQLAYVIYTSGSTGQPKGVQITHRSLVNYLSWASDTYLCGQPLSFALYSSLAFDLTVTSIFLPLISGSRLLVYPGEAREGVLDQILSEDKVEALKLTPSHLRLIAERDNRQSRVRRLIVGGEALPTQLAEAVMESFGGRVEIYNEYGPTEATVGCSVQRYEEQDQLRVAVPIGRPAANTRLYVLDARMRAVPVGVEGELYIGGDGLAEGYLNREELTEERFIADPFVEHERVYRSGDRARWLADGRLEYLGRGDEQVKRRGVRVELGELRAALNSHQGVRDSLVLVRQGAGGREVLVGYYVSRQEIDSEELRRHMAERVLVETVPEVYVHLRKMPLTLNGKVNPEGLPPWEAAGEQRGVEYVGARDEVEAELSAIWCGVLGVERVSVGDNFFSLGGHSLLATQVVSQVRERLGVEVGLKQLFERPTIEELAERVKETRASIGAAGAAGVERIGRVSREGELGLSYAQQRLWFLDQLEPGSAAYNIPIALRLSGRLEVSALERVLSEVVRRHEVLRTSFMEVDGQPVQVISPPGAISIPFIDLSHLSGEERQSKAQESVSAETRRAFDLAQGPLLRATLLRLDDEEHVLLVCMHHIVSDGWSMGLFIREMSALYAAFAAGEESPLAELEIQYADFAAWQREWLTGEVLGEQLEYWKEQLKGAPPVLELPTDRPRPAVQSYRGAHHAFALTPELTVSLKQLSQREGCTLFMTLLAAFQVLLSRYSGQEDVVVGTPIANRNRSEIEGLIGFFVNTLALRTELTGEPSFREVLKRVREVTLSAYAHQDVPFEKLVEELQPERSLSHQPLFQVAFSLQNAPRETLNLPGLQLSSFGGEARTAKFDLLLSVSESEEGISGAFEYSTDLFDEQTIRRFHEHFERLLQALTRDAEQQVATIPLLSAVEQEQLVVQWNQTSTEYPREACVHELFEQQAALRPDVIAVECQGVQLTYQELNERANQLAHHLRSLGVGTDSLVGVLMERSTEMVVALLGVLKAGAAYVPLDVNYPAPRLQYMLEETQAAVLLTQQGLVHHLPAHSAQVLCLDSEWTQIAQRSTDNLAINVSAADLAYVIYTSGSTGQPKGVCVPHRGVTRLVTQTTYASFSPDEVFLQLAPVSFDAATFELWGALLNGARLVVMPPQQPSLSELAEAIERYGITTLWLTAGLFHLMVEEQLESLGSLRQLLAGGDVLSAQDARRVLEAHPGLRLINGYGPTEATTFTCCHPIVAADVERGRLPIGRPIANTQVYILDERMRVLPIGVEGDLYIGGDGLARGYLNQPELTAEKFIPHPFGRMGGQRVYRSGDRARWLADGSVEFLGRTDNQVKVRGFRVELGEVEEALRQQACVSEAVALVSGEGVEKRLLAYVAGSGERLSEAELRQGVREQLPEYMAPAAVIVVEKMPLTSNGKIDRQALALMAPEPHQLEAHYEAARTPVEEILCAIWCDLLRVERVGVTDNFFELGGHSLLATQLVSRIRTAFETDIALKELFESPTVAELADRIEAHSGLRGQTRIARLERASRAEDLPASFAQQRMWFLHQLQRESAAYNLSSAMRLSGDLKTEVLEQSFGEMVRRHEILRTRLSEVEGQLVQVVEAARAVRLSVRDLSALPAAEREAEAVRVVGEEGRKPFDLVSGPLLRATLLRLDDEEHVLLVTMHHIISDGWSLGVMVREIKALYAAFAAGEESPLAELEIQYADFAAWQREWLTGEVLGEQLEYWKEQLKGAPPVLELPTDRPRPAVQSYRGAHHAFTLTPELTVSLKQLSQREGCTLFMTLLAAFQVLLSRYSGQEDVVVGTPIANRNRAEVEPLIGFFVNTLALRTDLSGEPSFREVLRRVREVTLSAYAHQDVPFEKLVEELQPERSLSHQPVFQVMFALQNAPRETLELPGLQLSSFGGEARTAKFDLLLSVSESEDGLGGAFEYSTDLFDEQTIIRLERHFERLLQAITVEAEQPVADIKVLTPAEHEQLVVQWNETATEYPHDRCVHELFEEQAALHPDAIAVECEDAQLTYKELNERANQLAHHLQDLGVGADSLVAILMHRSTEMVVAILGILKAGAAYVPLDASHPSARLNFILQDTAASVLLTQQHLVEQLPEHTAQVICLDAQSERAQIARQSAANLVIDVSAAELAYVIYTSGSTGQPKGVKITHRSLTNYLSWASETYLQGQLLSFALYSSLAFDLTVTSIFLPLISGSRLVVYSGEAREGVLDQILSEDKAEALKLTPSHLRLIAERDNRQSRVRRLIVGGEALPTQLAEAVMESFGGGVEIYNEYGPTEATVGCSVQRYEEQDQLRVSVPIGCPAANTRLYVLDERLRVVPVGVEGELYIGGAGLAEGYLNREELTEERFIADPFVEGQRLYRSGDRARWLADGRVDFLGRTDNQVQIRGFRIELGEIQSRLLEHSLVSKAEVIARQIQDGSLELVAYVAPSAEVAVTELRSHLSNTLPYYMIPSAFVMLNDLPLTPNGKVDHRALPLPDASRQELRPEYVAPRTSVEELLCDIWREVLGVERVGVLDNFFDLGGHSLRATQVVSRIREAFALEVPLQKLFESPCVADLAVALLSLDVEMYASELETEEEMQTASFG